MNRSKLEKAILRAFDGELDEATARELHDTLRRDRAARDLYREHAALERSFLFRYSRREAAAPQPSSLAEIALRRQQRRSFRIAIAAAAVALIALGLTLRLIFVPPTPPMARLESAAGSQFRIDGGGDADPGELGQQATVELSQGSLEITTRQGVRAVVLAPASFRMSDESVLDLHRGTAWFHVPPAGHGFRVATPQLEVTDLGTEFGVIARPDGTDEAHVFEGKIRVRARHHHAAEETLTARRARLVSPVGRLEEIAATPGHFLTALPQPPSDNLLANGDFEAGNPPADDDWGVPATPAMLPGWTFSPGIQVALRSENGRPGFGNGESNILSSTADTQVGFSVQVEGPADREDVTLCQTFATRPGQRYEVSFEMGGNLFRQETPSLTASVFDGTDVTPATGTRLAQHIEQRPGTARAGYNPSCRFVFTATSSRSTLVLTETTPNTSASDIAIDNVRVRRLAE